MSSTTRVGALGCAPFAWASRIAKPLSLLSALAFKPARLQARVERLLEREATRRVDPRSAMPTLPWNMPAWMSSSTTFRAAYWTDASSMLNSGDMGRPREFDVSTARSAIRDEFWQRGFAATSVDDLLAATGLGKGSFYAAFGDKRAVFLEVLREYSGAQVEAMRAQCGASRRAIEALRAILQPDPWPRGCFLMNCAFELAPQDAEVSALAHRTFVALQAVLADGVRQAVADGDLPASTRPVELAATLFTIRQGQRSLSRAGMSKTVLESVSRSAARALLGPGEPPTTTAKAVPRARGARAGEHERRPGRPGRPTRR